MSRIALLVALVLFGFVGLVVTSGCEKAPPATTKDQKPPPPPGDAPMIDAAPVEQPVDVAILLDLSKTMEETDMPRDRLDAAQTALKQFLAASSRDRFALVIFAREPKLLVPMTSDRDAVTKALLDVRVGDIPELGTALGDGLALAVEELTRAGAKQQAVILVADGENNWITKYDPDQAAALAKAAGIEVFTILVGKDDPSGLSSPPDPKTLMQISSVTGGAFYPAPDPAALERGLTEVRAKLDAMARTP